MRRRRRRRSRRRRVDARRWSFIVAPSSATLAATKRPTVDSARHLRARGDVPRVPRDPGDRPSAKRPRARRALGPRLQKRARRILRRIDRLGGLVNDRPRRPDAFDVVHMARVPAKVVGAGQRDPGDTVSSAVGPAHDVRPNAPSAPRAKSDPAMSSAESATIYTTSSIRPIRVRSSTFAFRSCHRTHATS
jgi:hypothetical protein